MTDNDAHRAHRAHHAHDAHDAHDAHNADDAAVIVCRGVEKTYRSGDRATQALRGVDLEVARGAWVAIMGPSGSGKSTLLHLLGGLDTPDAGSVMIDGADVSALSETRRALLRRRHIGYLFQFFNLVSDLSVAENVELPMLLVGERRREAHRRATELLESLGVGDVLGAAPAELSGGQQQRVALARALANRPAVLLADEPTGNLDTDSARQVLALLRAQHDAGQTIVMVTHDSRVAAAADRVLVMQDGAFTQEATVEAPSARGSSRVLADLVRLESQ
jgi:putative ABC transport system ATP-binding protein